MTETKKTYPKTQGKIIQYNYDFLSSLTGECDYCLTDAQVQAILTMTDYLAWPTRWISNNGTIDSVWIEEFRDDLNRRLLMRCSDEPGKLTRFTDDGVYQYSIDNGETWIDAPESDPRLSTPEPPRLSGTPGDNLRCAAADNIRDYYKQTRDTLLSLLAGSAIVTAIVSGLLGALAIVLFSTVVGAALGVIIWSMAAAAFSIGHDSAEEQLNDDVMNDFRCLVYDHLTATGEIDYAGWQALIEEIDSTFDDFPQTFFRAWTSAIGFRGLIAAGAAGVNTADDCDCAEEECSTTFSPGSKVFAIGGVDGFHVDIGNDLGTGIIEYIPATFPDLEIAIRLCFSEDFTVGVTSMENQFTASGFPGMKYEVQCRDSSDAVMAAHVFFDNVTGSFGWFGDSWNFGGLSGVRSVVWLGSKVPAGCVWQWRNMTAVVS